ncbi:MAG: hypothetical protein IJ555_06040 [Ruminococcus sp.]|nr:hypothetical protein [Ruminococcus sp.]
MQLQKLISNSYQVLYRHRHSKTEMHQSKVMNSHALAGAFTSRSESVCKAM